MNTRNGPSDRIRTCGIVVPNHARYQLRYTRASRGLRKRRESCISAPSFFLSESNPLRWASIRYNGGEETRCIPLISNLTKILYTSFCGDARETLRFFFV